MPHQDLCSRCLAKDVDVRGCGRPSAESLTRHKWLHHGRLRSPADSRGKSLVRIRNQQVSGGQTPALFGALRGRYCRRRPRLQTRSPTSFALNDHDMEAAPASAGPPPADQGSAVSRWVLPRSHGRLSRAYSELPTIQAELVAIGGVFAPLGRSPRTRNATDPAPMKIPAGRESPNCGGSTGKSAVSHT